MLMRRGENPTEVLKSVKAAVDDLNTDRLPPGVRVISRSTTARIWSTTRCTPCRTRCWKDS